VTYSTAFGREITEEDCDYHVQFLELNVEVAESG
jgi:hypothetical protein